MKADINSFTTRFMFDRFIKLETNKRFYQMTLPSQCFTFLSYWEKKIRSPSKKNL